jgi:hypothetical protein
MTEYHRRTALFLLAAATTSLAGCSESADETDDGTDDTDSTTGSDESGSDGLDDDGLPPYASLLPETDHSPYFYGAISFDTPFERDDLEEADQPADSLLVNPIAFVQFSWSGLAQLGGSSAVEAFSEHGETDDESAFVYANGVYAVTGAYDRADLGDALETAGYEPESSEEAYTVYRHGDADDVVGVADEAFAYALPIDEDGIDAVATVERTVSTATGDREPKHEADDAFGRLLRTGGAAGMSVGLYSRETLTAEELENESNGADLPGESDALEFQFGALEDAAGVHQQLSLGDGSASASAVVRYRDEDAVDVDRLESSFGTEANDVDVVRDGTAVAIEAEYADSVVDAG